jgi:AbrB family looped-hinge helix DNA binding protein
MRVTSNGQVTIPQEIRTRLGLLPNTEAEFELVGDYARIRKARRSPEGTGRGRLAVELLRKAGAGSEVRMTTDQILALTRGEPRARKRPKCWT